MIDIAKELLNAPLDREQTGMVREFLAGCQYFDARPLAPVLHIRLKPRVGVPVTREMLSFVGAHLPASPMCLFLPDCPALFLRDEPEETADYRFRCMYLAPDFRKSASLSFIMMRRDGTWHRSRAHDELKSNFAYNNNVVARDLLCAWFSLEAMQTKGGFTHLVPREPSRQQRRLSARQGVPCHKWVEIRLGRSPSAGRARKLSTGGEGRRGVAWHYRNGHPLNHPNPNQPKWREGGWVGSPDYGIRSHDYIIDPDGWLDD